MTHQQRELLVARICSGVIRIRVFDHNTNKDITLLVKHPTREQRYVAEEVREEAELEGVDHLYSESELVDYLNDLEIWNNELDELYQKLPGEIEEFKVGLFKNLFRSNERELTRKALEIARQKLRELEERRHQYDYLSCLGYANITKKRYLTGSSLHYPNGTPVFDNENFWEESSLLLEQAMSALHKKALGDAEIREIARTEPWRSMWSAKKSGDSLFGIPVVDYTDEQKGLVCWSGLYDSIFAHPECPSEDVIQDDDLLDGWMIFQRRENESSKGDSGIVGNEKIKNSQEIFLVADTPEDASKIMDLNDAQGRSTMRKRFKTIQEKGVVNELEMPDTKRRLRMEATAKFAKAMSNNR